MDWRNIVNQVLDTGKEVFNTVANGVNTIQEQNGNVSGASASASTETKLPSKGSSMLPLAAIAAVLGIVLLSRRR